VKEVIAVTEFGLIDGHQHVFWHGRDDRGLLADMDAHGIEKAWLLGWEESAEESGGSYASVVDPRWHWRGSAAVAMPLHTTYETYRRYPDRFIPGYCPHPLDPKAVPKLKAAIDILGVRVCGEWKFAIGLDDPRCIEIFRYAGSRGLPVIVHMDVPYLPPEGGRFVGHYSWKGGTIVNLERALTMCPNTNFLGHAPGFWRELTGDADTYPESYLKPPLKPGGRLPALFDKHPNIYGDLSAGSALRALKADPGIAREFLMRHPDRFVFARDYFGNDLREFLDSLDLPADVWRKIGRENAERLVASTAPTN
jgi:predicted TIM-barrel fold metal-dependent hydrolase